MTEDIATCPYCGGASGGAAYPYATHWGGRRFTYHECTGCRATFIHPLPTAGDLNSLFDRSAYHELHYAKPEPKREQLESLEWMRPHLKPCGRLLDFGCGNGAFMRAAQSAGYEVEGVEQNETSIAFAHEMSGLPVSALEDLIAAGRQFDAIHIADVLSHVPHPAELLHSLHRLLAPGGVLVIEGPLEKQPNLVYLTLAGGKRVLRAIGRGAEGTHPPLHLTFTSWKSQDRFFRQQMHYDCVALDLHEDAWPFPAKAEPGASRGTRAKALIGRAALALSRTPVARPLGAFNRFRAIYAPANP